MPKRSSKSPRDPNKLAKSIVDQATSDDADKWEPGREKDPAAVSLGRRGGLRGGRARAEKLTPEERSAIAQRAAASRWKKNDG